MAHLGVWSQGTQKYYFKFLDKIKISKTYPSKIGAQYSSEEKYVSEAIQAIL